MIVLGFADIHGDIKALKSVAGIISRADLVILAGDITKGAVLTHHKILHRSSGHISFHEDL